MQTSVYFFSAPGRIKIGISRDVAKRLAAVGSHMDEPPVLLGAVDGDFRLEKHLHEMLSPHRLRGEWFKDCPEVRDAMERVLHGGAAGVGFEPISSGREKFVPKPMTSEEWLQAFNRLVVLVFPDNTIESFAEWAQQPPDLCWAWLTGCEEIPKLLTEAFASRLVVWMLSDPQPSTL
jgi:hypothetical protein